MRKVAILVIGLLLSFNVVFARGGHGHAHAHWYATHHPHGSSQTELRYHEKRGLSATGWIFVFTISSGLFGVLGWTFYREYRRNKKVN